MGTSGLLLSSFFPRRLLIEFNSKPVIVVDFFIQNLRVES